MRYFAIALLAMIIGGCASDPAKRAAVAEEEVARYLPSTKSLAEFRDYQLKPITMSPDIMEDEDKVKVSQQLGTKLSDRITPLLGKWRADKEKTTMGSILIIEPKVQRLRIVSRAARFWLGAFMGESFIDMDLKLTDSATAQVIAIPRIHRSVGSMVGAWSIGATDRNLLDYIVDIAHHYLEVNYTLKATE